MQGRRPVEQHRMLANDFREDVPNFSGLPFHHLLGGLYRGRESATFELAEDERFEQFQRHFFRQAALMELQRRTHDDDRATRIVDTLAQQILPETPLLAFDHIRQRLERPLVRSGNRSSTATVVQKCIHRLLQHALFVAHDDVGRGQIQQTLQAVVAVDHPPIKVV